MYNLGCNDIGELVILKDFEFWKIFLKVVIICNYKLIFEIVEILEEGELNKVIYYR